MAPSSIRIEGRNSFGGFGSGGFGSGGFGSGGSDGGFGNGDNGGHTQSNESSDRDKDSSDNDKKSTKTVVHKVTFTSVQTSILSVTISPSPTPILTPAATPTPTTTPTEDNDNSTASTTDSFFNQVSSSSMEGGTAPTTSESAFTPFTTSPALPTSSSARLPAASIISIILSVLFFITLCLVIYVRNPRLPDRILGVFRRRQSRPTIRPFGPIDCNGARNDGPRQSFLSYLPFGHWRRPSSKVAEAFPSPARPLPSYTNYGLPRSTPLLFSKALGSEQSRRLSAFSGFNDPSFAGDISEASKASVKLSDWYSTTSYTPYSIPRSVDQMTAE